MEINSEQQAMVVEDAYELFLENVSLSDNADGAPLLFRGRHTGAIFTDDFPLDQMEFEDGLSKDVVMEAPAEQAW